MPFRSEKQRRWMWANKPAMARKWTEEHGSKPVPSESEKYAEFFQGLKKLAIEGYRPRASAIIFDNKGQVLVGRSSSNGVSTFLFPGGGIDPGESPAQAAQRETLEEAGYKVKDLRLVMPPKKLDLPDEASQRLKDKFGKGSLVHYLVGKSSGRDRHLLNVEGDALKGLKFRPLGEVKQTLQEASVAPGNLWATAERNKLIALNAAHKKVKLGSQNQLGKFDQEAYGPDGSTYFVPKLWQLAEKQNLKHVQVSSLVPQLETRLWKNRGGPPTPALSNTSPFHARKTEGADLNYPIILRSDGSILDGAHRLLKAHKAGIRTLPAVQLKERELRHALVKAAAGFAPGIPQKKITPLPEVKKPQIWELSAHPHVTTRSGNRQHIDLRLGNPGTRIAHSFALPKAKMPEPGESKLIIPTFDHTLGYMNFTGNLGHGYGHGKVIPGRRTVAEVFHADPSDKPGTKLRFNLYDQDHPQEYAIRKDEHGRWFLHNKTQTREQRPDLPSSKTSYKEVGFDNVDVTDDKQALMPKLDGAHTVVDLQAGRAPRVFSYRVGKVSQTGLIEHTHKIPELLKTKVPKELDKTILRAETLGVREGKPISAEQTGGLLNAKVWESRAKQNQTGTELKAFPFSVVRYQGKDMSNASFEEKRKILDKVQNSLPSLEAPPLAVSSAEKVRLLNEVKAKVHPLTEEGVVLVDRNAIPEQFTKAKIRPDFDVFVRAVHPAVNSKTGQPHDRAGAVSYSWTPDGPIAGQLSGFSHDLGKDMLKNQDKYVGRVAKVRATKVFEGKKGQMGALFQPSFKEWHLDKGDIEKVGTSNTYFDDLRKLAYTWLEHITLANEAAKSMAGRISKPVKEQIADGSVAVDFGLSAPIFPWSDPQHAFPSLPKKDIVNEVRKVTDRGAKDVAGFIAGEESEYVAVRGLRAFGRGSHTMADIFSHRDKPTMLEKGQKDIANLFKKISPKGYGGQIPALLKHTVDPTIDLLKPEKSEVDRAAIEAQKNLGESAVAKIERALKKEHGFSNTEAAESTQKFLRTFKPSTTSKLLGRGSTGISYTGEQLSRAKDTLYDALHKQAFDLSSEQKRFGLIGAGALGAAALGAGAYLLHNPMWRRSIQTAISSIGKGGTFAAEAKAPIPAAVSDTAKRIVEQITAQGLDPSSLRFAVAGTGGTGKTTLSKALAAETGGVVRSLDSTGKSPRAIRDVLTAKNVERFTRNTQKPGSVSEQLLLLNQKNMDNFDVLVHVSKDPAEVKKQLMQRGRGAFQWEVVDNNKLDRGIRAGFENAAGTATSVAPGIQVKIKPSGGFMADEMAAAELRRMGGNPVGLDRPEILASIAREGDRTKLPGILPYLNYKNIAKPLAAGGIAGTSAATGVYYGTERK